MPWKRREKRAKAALEAASFNSATAVMPWKPGGIRAGGSALTRLQFGHGCDAVETGLRTVREVIDRIQLQFGHGCDAVETLGLGVCLRQPVTASIRPRL